MYAHTCLCVHMDIHIYLHLYVCLHQCYDRLFPQYLWVETVGPISSVNIKLSYEESCSVKRVRNEGSFL